MRKRNEKKDDCRRHIIRVCKHDPPASVFSFAVSFWLRLSSGQYIGYSASKIYVVAWTVVNKNHLLGAFCSSNLDLPIPVQKRG